MQRERPFKFHAVYRSWIFRLSLGGIFLFYLWLVFFTHTTPLPSTKTSLLLYSNQTRQDLKHLFLHAIKKAKTSLFLSVYGITDPDILNLLHKKSLESLPVHVEFDPTASLSLGRMPSTLQLFPIRSKGLMHQKILIVDATDVYLGSANLTPSSLRHHDNLVVGLYHPPLAQFLKNPEGATSFSFSIDTSPAELYLLPDPYHLGLERLLKTVNDAKTSIHIAMFTLTHPKIQEALIQAKKRGVDVRIAIDYFTAKGASQKAVEHLSQAQIPLFFSQGRQLLHHKWAWIDGELLVMGSANWTKSAFTKNRDFLLFLPLSDKKHKRFLNTLWKIIETECNNHL